MREVGGRGRDRRPRGATRQTMQRQTRARTRASRASTSAAPFRILHELPHDLQLRVADSVDDLRDRARLCLALPPLGLMAMQSLARYQQFNLRVGMELVLRGTAIDDALFRRYGRDQRANYEGLLWLNAAAAEEDSEWSVLVRPERPVINAYDMKWILRRGCGMGAELRRDYTNGLVFHNEGERDAERLVRVESTSGMVFHYEGERGAERKTRAEGPGYGVTHFEGEKDAERKLRTEYPDGSVVHFEGAKDAERQVRLEHADGMVAHYEGAKDAEHLVRMKLEDGSVAHYEGAKGAERRVRVE